MLLSAIYELIQVNGFLSEGEGWGGGGGYLWDKVPKDNNE